ncbi:V-type proton ATPase subunit C [Plasmodiophora brassicae]|uniref:V-type proton ATPase subunit C n=1 Tax=Plasmodiophora brassicae TaxID=37360 RepID=A0A0G4IK89_PLABS|nr:hypothetical protein PBRA_004279 [Plasmodiophora brassicae]SPR00427.1 unnamed protein product [Plasmodiophora brassicae]
MGDAAVRFWIVAVPTEVSSHATLSSLSHAVADLGHCSELTVPKLPVGTLDQLMEVGDALAKFDETAESTVRKIAKQYVDTLAEHRKGNATSGAPPRLVVDNDSPVSYFRRYQWDHARYPLGASLATISDGFNGVAIRYGDDLKVLTQKYGEVKTSLQALLKKESGSLLVRPLNAFVNRNDMVEGDYLESAVVIVPVKREKHWLDNYERIEDEYTSPDNEAEPAPFVPHTAKCRSVVPGTSLELFRDEESIAYRVVLIKKYRHRFIDAARVHRYVCREYHYDELEVSKAAAAKSQLEQEYEYLWRNLIKWCATAYSEVFKAWVHIKIVRTFVESVLRFGLPINFTAVTIEVKPEREERLRFILDKHYAHLAGARLFQSKDEVDYSGVGADFYPYVFLKLDV